MTKKKVAILCGGQSAEHEISIISAQSVLSSLSTEAYEVTVVGISHSGEWLRYRSLDHFHKVNKVEVNPEANESVVFVPGRQSFYSFDQGQFEQVHVVFPLLHGPKGEDGSIQGLFELANIPYVGAGVLGSAVGMDKDVMKRLFLQKGIPTSDYVSFFEDEAHQFDFTTVKKKLGSPLFIKPANMGSSVGVSRVESDEEYRSALKEAFSFDQKVLVEAYVDGREIEIGVLGDRKLQLSLAGEIVPNKDFYSYKSKYLDDTGAQLLAPTELTDSQYESLKDIAIKVFRCLECKGLARVDCFWDRQESRWLVNEINTMPGFTKISMYPKLWEKTGTSYSDLLNQLIETAIDTHRLKSRLRVSYDS